MPSWKLKAAVQGTLSLLPLSHRWNYLLQKYASRSLRLNETAFERQLQRSRQYMQYYFDYGSKTDGFSLLELGTGWHPILPISAVIFGARQVWTVDKTAWLNADLLRDTLSMFLTHADKLGEVRRDKVDLLQWALRADTAAEGLQRLNITYIKGDAQQTGLPAGVVDYFVSNFTLEHIPKAIIQGIFEEFRRLAARDAVMCHFIDMNDHYSYFDSAISPYNFLQYSEQQWRFYNNTLHYQNRLRVSDYRELHARTGFEILHEYNNRKPQLFDHVRLYDAFRAYALDDLTVTSSWMVSKSTGIAV